MKVVKINRNIMKTKKIDTRPVTECIKTFEDAYKELGRRHPFVKIYDVVAEYCRDKCNKKNYADAIAYLKLRIVTKALNEEWEPKFTKGEYYWQPFFYLMSEDVLNSQDDEWKQDHLPISTKGYNTKWTYFVSVHSINAASFARYADLGVHLYYKNETLADYSGRQFAHLWMDYCLLKKQ